MLIGQFLAASPLEYMMSFTADTLILFGATGDLAQRMLLP
jgi:hypothetical protein